jgi:exodeoxyribonuclease V alpha subunit
VSALPEIDPLDARHAVSATGVLGAFNEAGVLASADVHVATTLAALAGIDDERVLLAAALAVRGPRLGHVRVDLAEIRERAAVDADETVDVAALPWPEPDAWLAALRASPIVADGEEGEDGGPRPLRLSGTALYLDRYWREEREVAADLRALAVPAGDVDEAALADGIARLFGDEPHGRQALAAASAVLRRLAVVAGGPGTGKTTTVARIVTLVCEQHAHAGRPAPLIALAAPTGKAAARLQEAVREAVPALDTTDPVKAHLQALEAQTLHRLLGWRPRSHSRFRHDRSNRLPYDVVLVDETSMVSLSLMARLVEAIREGARLVLVGDPGQLTSIEAGVVLGDVVGPAKDGLLLSGEARARLSVAVGHDVDAAPPPPGASVADGIVLLDRGRRFGEAIADVAAAVRLGDADEVVAALRAHPHEVTWLDADVAEPGGAQAVERIRAEAVAAVARVVAAARDGDAATALQALDGFRLLCAHRRGPHGVSGWTERIERWLAEGVDRFETDGRWYVGRPLLVTENDYALRLYNGDTGVVVAGGDGEVVAAFDRGGEVLRLRPGRLEAVESVYAMTIHKSQGSQFATAAVLLPPPASPILTRELLYTAVTRARTRLVVAGTEDAVRAAVGRPAARASGLQARLWGG